MEIAESKLIGYWFRWSVLVTYELFSIHRTHLCCYRFYVFDELFTFVFVLEYNIDRWSILIFELELHVFVWDGVNYRFR